MAEKAQNRTEMTGSRRRSLNPARNLTGAAALLWSGTRGRGGEARGRRQVWRRRPVLGLRRAPAKTMGRSGAGASAHGRSCRGGRGLRAPVGARRQRRSQANAAGSRGTVGGLQALGTRQRRKGREGGDRGEMGIERGDVAALGGGRRETRSRGVGIDQRGFERWVLAPRGEKALGEMGIGRGFDRARVREGVRWAGP